MISEKIAEISPRAPETRCAEAFTLGTILACLLVTAGHADDHGDILPEDGAAGVEQRLSGAGTNPDGVVDEKQEGLFNQTDTDDFIDNSAATDTTSPLLETPEAGPDPATSARDLEPPVANEDFEAIDRALQPENEDG